MRRGERAEHLAIGQARRMGRDDVKSMPLPLAVASSSPGRARSRWPSSAPSCGSSAASCGSSTGQTSSAITRSPLRSLKPRRTDRPPGTNANRARRRLPGAVRTSGSTRMSSSSCCASAAATCWRFHAPYCKGGTCCSWQPPHAPKWGHGGAARGACSSQSTGWPTRPSPRPPAMRTRRRSPGSVSGTKILAASSRARRRRARRSPRS